MYRIYNAAHMWYENKVYNSNTNEDIYNPEKTRRVSIHVLSHPLPPPPPQDTEVYRWCQKAYRVGYHLCFSFVGETRIHPKAGTLSQG